jgi:glucokinase
VLEHYRCVYAVEPLSVCVARVISGIGFAIYTNGHSLEDFGFIDFGHIIVQAKDGAKCICGGTGCLEAYSSSAGICNRVGVTNFSEIANNREKYRSYLDDAAFYLGITFANIKRIFSIGKVVVTGNVLENDEIMVNKVVESIKEHLTIDSVEFEYVQELSASFGAARLSLLDKIAIGKTL